MAGIRKANRRDLVLIECVTGSTAAAVFTKNRFCAAPVIVAREHLAQRMPRALVINTGFANAGTGEPGLHDARATCEAVARQLGCQPNEVLPFSTGVIGQRFPIDRLIAGIPFCAAALSDKAWAEAARGIMTTDTVPKGSTRRVAVGGQTVTITGISKGSGMIRPDMATMLAFVATDARVEAGLLQRALTAAMDVSFNRITVDGDTSTNDACVLLATGKGAAIDEKSPAFESFQHALNDVCAELAQAIVRDGEGATKFITVDVGGGASASDCLEVAYTVAHSPLIKTAFFASDPNWGRILAAIGRAPIAKLNVETVSVDLNDVRIVTRGALDPAYTEEKGAAVMKQAEIRIGIDLGMGKASAQVWTTDFSYDYVRINAEYRS
jgi:glutamate N-acetyltransferase/amino-acid N-acetyltransferase